MILCRHQSPLFILNAYPRTALPDSDKSFAQSTPGGTSQIFLLRTLSAGDVLSLSDSYSVTLSVLGLCLFRIYNM